MRLHPELERYVRARQAETAAVPPERRLLLDRIRAYVDARPDEARLVFLCTHNSRRSHLAQVWAQVMAAVGDFRNVRTYSGGTEATAVYPGTLDALERAGMRVVRGEGSNPVHRIEYGPGLEPLAVFSKVYDRAPNPRSGFCAVMTCDEADANCPVVSGAELRVALTHPDPKAADGRPEAARVYDERCRILAVEMAALFAPAS